MSRLLLFPSFNSYSCSSFPHHLGVDLIRAFVSKVRRSSARYTGVDSDPEVCYERMPNVHFAIDGEFD